MPIRTPAGGEWNAWYARFCNVIDRSQARKDDAGRLARRWEKGEMASLWVFLVDHGDELQPSKATSHRPRIAVQSIPDGRTVV